MVITDDRVQEEEQKSEEEEQEVQEAESPRVISSKTEPGTVIVVTKGNSSQSDHLLLRSLLKNRRNPGRIEKIKIIRSPVTDIRNASMSNRTNLRLQLMRQQLIEEEKRETVLSSSFKPSSVPSKTIDMPTVSVTSTEVPPQVLRVETNLQFPTKYHMQQNKKRQIQMFLNQGQVPVTVQSLPAVSSTSAPGDLGFLGSAPADPDSPLSMGLSSVATSTSEVDNFLSDIISLESVEACLDSDLTLIEPSLTQMSSTMPQSQLLNTYSVDSAGAKSSSSCPAAFRKEPTPSFITEDDEKAWYKERQKKDNHNMIERRRRFNINDRIKELGTMLPRSSDPDLRQNKGSILKASVDYIRKLKRDQEKVRQLEDQRRQLEAANRRYMLKVQQLELLMKAHGVSTGYTEDMMSLTTMIPPSAVNFQPRQEMDQSDMFSSTPTNSSLIEEEDSPVSGDPMMMSAPVSPSLGMEDDSDFL
ncbi:microphthalmia-associated transcription factor-like isoform X1 [Haliotis rufescens]|uniref:microphthalmia-associated transcription factor-like isoform X1 n=1 Tax=Haliotis rufescens TaxID=6454 RepID=UPI001EAFDC8A|nr:microphthalmia-associated transcription factor-like isoform X1 [Haliotis rufescens]